MINRVACSVVISLGIIFLNGCGAENKTGHDHSHDHHGHEEGEGHGHSHAALHGGTLLALGEHFAHLEIVLDSASGKLTVYVQDKEAENSVRIGQEYIALEITLGAGESEQKWSVKLEAVSSELSGEKVGDTSEFSVEDEKLKGVKAFKAILKSVIIMDKEFKDLAVQFPEGNEK